MGSLPLPRGTTDLKAMDSPELGPETLNPQAKGNMFSLLLFNLFLFVCVHACVRECTHKCVLVYILNIHRQVARTDRDGGLCKQPKYTRYS